MTSGAIAGAPKLILCLEGAALALSAAFFFWRDGWAMGLNMPRPSVTHIWDTLSAKSGRLAEIKRTA
jgi:hypothetical protein